MTLTLVNRAAFVSAGKLLNSIGAVSARARRDSLSVRRSESRESCQKPRPMKAKARRIPKPVKILSRDFTPGNLGVLLMRRKNRSPLSHGGPRRFTEFSLRRQLCSRSRKKLEFFFGNYLIVFFSTAVPLFNKKTGEPFAGEIPLSRRSVLLRVTPWLRGDRSPPPGSQSNVNCSPRVAGSTGR